MAGPQDLLSRGDALRVGALVVLQLGHHQGVFEAVGVVGGPAQSIQEVSLELQRLSSPLGQATQAEMLHRFRQWLHGPLIFFSFHPMVGPSPGGLSPALRISGLQHLGAAQVVSMPSILLLGAASQAIDQQTVREGPASIGLSRQPPLHQQIRQSPEEESLVISAQGFPVFVTNLSTERGGQLDGFLNCPAFRGVISLGEAVQRLDPQLMNIVRYREPFSRDDPKAVACHLETFAVNPMAQELMGEEWIAFGSLHQVFGHLRGQRQHPIDELSVISDAQPVEIDPKTRRVLHETVYLRGEGGILRDQIVTDCGDEEPRPGPGLLVQ